MWTAISQRASRDDAPDGRYARHMVRGWDQTALSLCTLFVLPHRAPDPVASRLMLAAAAMGVEDLFLAGDVEPDSLVIERITALNPSVRIRLGSPALAWAEATNVTRGGGCAFVAADAEHRADQPSSATAELLGVRFYRYDADGVALGDSVHGIRRKRVAEHAGAHLAAGSLLSSLVASSGAYYPAPDEMPEAPSGELHGVLRERAAMPERRRLVMLLVGGGGALSHAYLEAVLADAPLRKALGGGRLAIVDPDVYAVSNLNRQSLAGGRHNLGRSKAHVTAEELRRLWPEHEPCPEVVAYSEPLRAEHIWIEHPDVVLLFADNFLVRHAAYEATRRLGKRTLVICAGTEFTHGQARAVVTHSESCCFDCGPERLMEAAARELRENQAPAGCSREQTPSNILTNLWVGALAALQTRKFLSQDEADPRQQLVSWMLPSRVAAGPRLASCPCGGAR